MSPSLPVLFIEDNPGDVRLVQEELRSAVSQTWIQLEWVDCLEKGLEWITANRVEAVKLFLRVIQEMD